jgi:hypothetical protein
VSGSIGPATAAPDDRIDQGGANISVVHVLHFDRHGERGAMATCYRSQIESGAFGHYLRPASQNPIWQKKSSHTFLGNFFKLIYQHLTPLLPLAGEGSFARSMHTGNLFVRNHLTSNIHVIYFRYSHRKWFMPWIELRTKGKNEFDKKILTPIKINCYKYYFQ